MDDNPSTPGQPTRYQVREGGLVCRNGTVYKITDILDFESVVAIAIKTSRKALLPIAELDPVPPAEETECRQPRPIDAITRANRKSAARRLKAIRPLLKKPRPSRADFDQRAHKVGCHYTTLYRWYRHYNELEDATVLIPQKRGWKAGKDRIAPDDEELINHVIEKYYLKKGGLSIKNTIRKVGEKWRKANGENKGKPPSASTIRNRINRIPEEERLRRRGFHELARKKFRPTPGHFPGGTYPLEVIQIDHTKADIILVDDVYRKPIGRPHVTLGIDIHTRMVTGYYLSFDDPSVLSVAMCISQSVLPKEHWLSQMGVEAQWPVWGFPETLHVDNASEFRSKSLRNSCLKYNINLEYRPLRLPETGGHVERVIGTVMKQIHDLPGTTFSSVGEKGEYDSEKMSALTISEFERVLVELICNFYHNNIHENLDMTPLMKWKIGIFGNDTCDGIGLPERPANPFEVERDFLPQFEGTVQRAGVRRWNKWYYAPVLNQWIGTPDPNNSGRSRRFTFRYDPRDISVIWIWDPDTGQYFDLPASDQSLDSVSLWEWQEAKKLIREEGYDPESSATAERAIATIREIADEAQAKKKGARRSVQKRKEHERKPSPATTIASAEETDSTPEEDKLSDEPVRIFSIIE